MNELTVYFDAMRETLKEIEVKLLTDQLSKDELRNVSAYLVITARQLINGYEEIVMEDD